MTFSYNRDFFNTNLPQLTSDKFIEFLKNDSNFSFYILGAFNIIYCSFCENGHFFDYHHLIRVCKALGLDTTNKGAPAW